MTKRQLDEINGALAMIEEAYKAAAIQEKPAERAITYEAALRGVRYKLEDVMQREVA